MVVRLWVVVPRVKVTLAVDVKFEPTIETENPGLPADAEAGVTLVRPTAPMVKNCDPVDATLPFTTPICTLPCPVIRLAGTTAVS